MSNLFKRKKADGTYYKHCYTRIGGKKVCLGISDKQAAEMRRSELIKEHELEKVGLIAPKPLREASKKPILAHLEDFLKDKITTGRCVKRIQVLELFIKKLLKECGWSYLEDLKSADFIKWRSMQKNKSSKTLNEYLGVMITFSGWLLKQGKIFSNPFTSVERMKQEKTFYRRSFTEDEARRLLSVSPIDRKAIYHIAFCTGLRHGEIAKLEWNDFILDGEKPCLKLRGKITKNRKGAVLPLVPELIETLKEYGQNREKRGLVFKKVLRFRDMRKDWEQAKIPVYDENGLKADFHALRGTFCTFLQKAGIPFQVAQLLMRHSDYRLTSQIYTDSGAFNLHSAVSVLPKLRLENCAGNCAGNCAVPVGFNSQKQSSSVNKGNEENKVQCIENDGVVTNCHERKLAP